MKTSQALKLIDRLKNAFPRPVMEWPTVKAYATAIEDLPFDVTAETIDRLIRTEKWLPAISEIRNETTEPEGLPEWGEAWAEVLLAVGRYGRDREPEFSTPEISEAVAGIGWRALCNQPEEQLATTRAQFRDVFKQFAGRSRKMANVGPRQHRLPSANEPTKLPQATQGAIESTVSATDAEKA